MAQRKKQICILFDQVPEGTNYRAGSYSWVPVAEGRQYIDKGYGKEYDPETQEAEELPPAEPEDDYPAGFPEAIKNICKQDDRTFEDVQSLYEDESLQEINGVGDSTETKIQNYFE